MHFVSVYYSIVCLPVWAHWHIYLLEGMVHSLDSSIVTLLPQKHMGIGKHPWVQMRIESEMLRALPVCYAHPASAPLYIMVLLREYFSLPSRIFTYFILTTFQILDWSTCSQNPSLSPQTRPSLCYAISQFPIFYSTYHSLWLYIIGTVWTVPATMIHSWGQDHASFTHIEFLIPSRMLSTG